MRLNKTRTPFAFAALLLAACGDDPGGAARGDADGTAPSDVPDSADPADSADSADAADVADLADSVAPDPGPNACRNPGTEGATARCVAATLPAEHYVAEALAYFDTLDVSASEESVPDYDPQVARWEWPPWLLLTAFTAEDTIQTGRTLRQIDPSTVPVRDCRFFDEQPFARCFVEFEYPEGRCPIYEEFTFDDEGQTTFIEAWSNLPALLPQDLSTDRWAEASDFPRLSTRVPGLGRPGASLDLSNPWLLRAATEDAQVADFLRRAGDWWSFWFEQVGLAGSDYFERGCGW